MFVSIWIYGHPWRWFGARVTRGSSMSDIFNLYIHLWSFELRISVLKDVESETTWSVNGLGWCNNNSKMMLLSLEETMLKYKHSWNRMCFQLIIVSWSGSILRCSGNCFLNPSQISKISGSFFLSLQRWARYAHVTDGKHRALGIFCHGPNWDYIMGWILMISPSQKKGHLGIVTPTNHHSSEVAVRSS